MISNIKYTVVPRGWRPQRNFSLIFLDPTPLLPHFPQHPSSLFPSCSHPVAAKTIINYPYPAAPSHPSSFRRWGSYAAWLLSNPLSVHHLSLSFSENELRLTAREQINNNHRIAVAGVGHVTEQTIIWICSHVHITAHIKHSASMSTEDGSITANVSAVFKKRNLINGKIYT